MIHLVVKQKPTHNSKATILQFKKKERRKGWNYTLKVHITLFRISTQNDQRQGIIFSKIMRLWGKIKFLWVSRNSKWLVRGRKLAYCQLFDCNTCHKKIEDFTEDIQEDKLWTKDLGKLTFKYKGYKLLPGGKNSGTIGTFLGNLPENQSD